MTIIKNDTDPRALLEVGKIHNPSAKEFDLPAANRLLRRLLDTRWSNQAIEDIPERVFERLVPEVMEETSPPAISWSRVIQAEIDARIKEGRRPFPDRGGNGEASDLDYHGQFERFTPRG